MSSFLPPEIVTKILSMLPVKPLLRFRCVSKPWCSLIDSPDFAKMHLNQSIISNSNRNLILGFRTYSNHAVELRSLDSPLVDSIDSSQLLKAPFSDSILSGSCNGLILCEGMGEGMRDFRDAPLKYIWNPFTRKYRGLPPDPFATEYCSSINGLPVIEAFNSGFAYVSETDEYKVVKLKEYRGIDRSYFGNEAYIFSSKSNKWERLEPFPYPISYKRVWGAHLNGSLHSVVKIQGSLQWKLMAFDTRSKEHSMLPRPKFPSRFADVTVEVFEGSICLLHERERNSLDVQIDIWVMKDYGVEDSWFKLLPVAIKAGPFRTVYPLAYSDDGTEVLIKCNRDSLIWASLKGKDVRRVAVKVFPLEFYAEVYFESLVSLPGFISVDDGNAKSQGSNDVDKTSQQKICKEKGNTSLTKGFLSQGFKLKL